MTYSDPDHSEGESRFLTFGMTTNGKEVVVVHTDRNYIIRIISGRKMKTEQSMRDEYAPAELGERIRGKYYESYRSSHNIVKLNPEVAEVFSDEASINEALMELIRIARMSASAKTKANGTPLIEELKDNLV